MSAPAKNLGGQSAAIRAELAELRHQHEEEVKVRKRLEEDATRQQEEVVPLYKKEVYHRKKVDENLTVLQAMTSIMPGFTLPVQVPLTQLVPRQDVVPKRRELL
ncbi:hypothetical protein LIER_41808 [Lithospermum erythrorhizon]|uniref:Uncharacterized protein n=1 Tax=Lithospermum erythrorhizon TaxID=34254 RepID=A0AAV3RI55_LITER